ncbi:tetratricopeptide repeat protein [Sphingobacterium siyangense]|uniref:tetratricopeptide repeat-containing sensor histidine kinase n=1 Tax=Sphingobacterium siyangense TaxID=459529 RepID=UPI002010C38B|nr:histidine kinase dimerization/phosphoacceptor domain -containing protein [Sphingobacterium siyangense]UQA76789.1 tetratricopeptide repeat protein [Sphingobacterium siyangense]
MRIYLILSIFILSIFNTFGQDNTTIHRLLDSISHEKDPGQKARILYEAAKCYLEKPGESKKDLDSALWLNGTSQKLHLSVNLKTEAALNMLLDARIQEEMGKPDLAKSQKKASLLFANAHQLAKASAMIYLSMANDIKDVDFHQKTSLFQQALEQAKKTSDKSLEPKILMEQSSFLSNYGDYKGAIATAHRAAVLKKQTGDKNISQELVSVAGNLRMLLRLKEALKYALEARRVVENENTTTTKDDLAAVYNIVGLIYYDLKSNKEALENYQKAFEIAKSQGDRYGIHTITLNLATILSRLNRVSDALNLLDNVTKDYASDIYSIRYAYLYTMLYTRNKNTKKAYPYYQELLTYYKTGNITGQERHIMMIGIASYLFADGQIKQMYPYLEEIERSMTRESSLLRASELRKLYYLADSARGDFKSAFKNLAAFKTISDSINSVERAKELTALQLDYDTEKKDHDIVLLKQKGQLQKSLLEREAIIRNVFIGSFVVLLIFAGFLYIQNAIKKRSNAKLTLKQEEINAQNEKLKQLIAEKEWLLKEIHHRVKNNMQIIISLLNTQSAYLENEDAISAIQNSQNRMHAMSLIHQKLYQTDNLSHIDMKWYIQELTEYLKDSFQSEKSVKFEIQVDPITLDVAQAVPVGLILNEAINNAIKHAFAQREGTVFISFRRIKATPYDLLLSIADNGIGIQKDLSSSDSDSFGMNLMQGLTSQLDGEFKLTSDQGVFITIQFSQKEGEI